MDDSEKKERRKLRRRNREAALDLLDQIIQNAKQKDETHKMTALKNHKASQAVGESWMVFHLKVLRELLSRGKE